MKAKKKHDRVKNNQTEKELSKQARQGKAASG